MAKKPTRGASIKPTTHETGQGPGQGTGQATGATRKKPTAAKAKKASKPANSSAAKRAAIAAAAKRAAAAAIAAAAPEMQSSAPLQGGQNTRMRMGENENYLDFLSRVFDDMSSSQWDTQKFDDVTQGVSLVLGSGPAFAALESMLAFTTSQSAVLMNAVQTQRQLDQVGLCCTSACVKQLLNMNNNQDTD